MYPQNISDKKLMYTKQRRADKYTMNNQEGIGKRKKKVETAPQSIK